ncbi:MAG TPA: hypothetical protein VLO07_10190, partial [Thermoanaerobaculia bacterium]|nr:hypothetical protein [Thermoanaerobaculia bacterium]
VTYGDWNDEDPSLSPDGKRLFFTSDRDGGIYNIYSVDVETGETLLHTNVVAGAFAPTVFVGKDNAEKLVFTAYYKRRFTLYIADPKKPVRKLSELNPSVSPAAAGAIAPFQPAIEVAVDREKLQPKAGHKLFLENAQVIAGVNTDQTFYSDTILIFGDNLGDRRFIAVIESLAGFTVFDFSYWNLAHRLQTGIRAFDSRTYYLGVGQLGGQLTLQRAQQAARYTGGSLLGLYPLSRYFRLEGDLSFISRSVDYNYLVGVTGGQTFIGFQNVKNNYPQIGLQLTADTVEYQEWGPRAGYRFLLGYSYAPDFKKDTSLPPGTPIGSTLAENVNFDLRDYLPISKRMLFALRLVGYQSTGNIPDICAFGGLDTFRGVDYGTKFGNSCGYANFEFRFPLVDLIALPWIGFRDIRGHVFFDIAGSKLKGGHFQLWDSGTKRLKDASAAYGGGIDAYLLGLPFHIDFAKQTDLNTSLSGFKTSWYIGYTF